MFVFDSPGLDEREWLITNGIGGYASSTLVGANTRTYHGLLIASLPYLRRYMVLSSLDEVVDGHELATHFYVGATHPQGYKLIKRVEVMPEKVRWVYALKKNSDENVVRELSMLHGRNSVVVDYWVPRSSVQVKPLVGFRSIHATMEDTTFEQIPRKHSVYVKFGGYELRLCASRGAYHPEDCTYYNFRYPREEERELNSVENLFCPGTFVLEDVESFRITATLVNSSACNTLNIDSHQHDS